MKIKLLNTYGFRLSVEEGKEEGKKEIGRVFLFIMRNDIRGKDFAYIEDLFVDAGYRGLGHGTSLVKKCIELAKELGCYKIELSTQYDYLHHMYEEMGFEKSGTEFKIYL